MKTIKLEDIDFLTFHEDGYGLSTNAGDQPSDVYLNTVSDLVFRRLYDYEDLENYEIVGEFLKQDGVWEIDGYRDWRFIPGSKPYSI
jgi:hypothetical protein